MSEKDLILKMILQAKDGMSGVIKKATRSSDADFKALQDRLKGTAEKFDTVGRSATKIGAVLTGLSAVNVKLAADFQDSMANVETLIDSSKESIIEIGDEVMNISRRVPVALNDLTEGLYSIRSAGIEASNQFNVLEKSAILGVAGRGSTAEAVDLVTSSLNAFRMEGDKANRVYDNIFKTVKYGKTTISGIAQGFGATAGVVAAANIELDEYLAAIAAMTTTGNPASQAHTQIKAAVAGLTRGTKEQAEVFRQLGAKNWQDLIIKSGGMVNAFKKIDKAINGNQAKMIQLVGSIEAYNAIKSLTGANNAKYIEALNDMRNGHDALAEGYAKKLNTLNASTSILKNSVQGLSIEFGNALLPAVNSLAVAASGATNIIASMPDELKSIIAIGVVGFGAVALAVGGLSFAVSGCIRSFSTMLNVVREVDIFLWAYSSRIKMLGQTLAGGFVSNIGKAIGAIRAFNVACLFNPVGLIVAAVVAGAFLIYKYWKPISAFFVGLFEGIKAGLEPLQPLFNALGVGARIIFTKIAEKLAPLSPLFEWIGSKIKDLITGIKNFFKPVNSEGTKAAQWGYNIGKGIAWCITKVISLYSWYGKLIARAARIKLPWKTEGNTKVKVDGSHKSGLDRVPHDGYIAELHKKEAVLNEKDANIWHSLKSSESMGAFTLVYSPNVTFSQNINEETKKSFMQMLQEHKKEIAQLVESVQTRKFAGAYGI